MQPFSLQLESIPKTKVGRNKQAQRQSPENKAMRGKWSASVRILCPAVAAGTVEKHFPFPAVTICAYVQFIFVPILHINPNDPYGLYFCTVLFLQIAPGIKTQSPQVLYLI